MSLPDELLDDPSEVCSCGNVARVGGKNCYECCEEFADLYADMKIQDAFEKEGK
jgi:hypothetical protein